MSLSGRCYVVGSITFTRSKAEELVSLDESLVNWRCVKQWCSISATPLHFCPPQPLKGENLTTVEFVDNTIGMNIPKAFIPAIEKGFHEACDAGMLSGHRVVGVKMVLTDGE